MAKPFVFLLLTSLFLLISNGSAYEFTVGGSGDWSHASTPYNQWAQKTILQIGDSISFVYEAGKDSVLQVRLEDYMTCNTTSPIANYSDGHSLVKLNEPGHYYFISGLVDHCKNNKRIAIVVMAYPSSNPLLSIPPPSPPTSTSTESLFGKIMKNILMVVMFTVLCFWLGFIVLTVVLGLLSMCVECSRHLCTDISGIPGIKYILALCFLMALYIVYVINQSNDLM